MAFAAASNAASSRLAPSTHAAPLRCPAAVSGAPRTLNICSARSGYEQEAPRRPTRAAPSSGGWEDEEDAQFDPAPSARPAFNNNGGNGGNAPRQNNGGYAPREGGYAPREGGYQSRDSGGGQQFANRPPRREYNNDGGGGGGQEGEGQDRPQRRQYNNNNNGGQEGENQDRPPRRQYNNDRGGGGGGGGGTPDYRPRQQYGGGQRQQYNGGEGQGYNNRGGEEGGEGRWGPERRERLSPEQMAMREEIKSALREATGWRALALVLAEKGQFMDAENISFLFSKVSRDARPANPDAASEYDQLLSTLLGWVLSLLPTFRPRQTAMNITTLGKLQLYSPEVVTGLMDMAANQMINFSDNELCQIIVGCSMVGHEPTPAFITEFETRTIVRLPRMKITDLTRMLSGLHGLKALPVGRPWLDQAMAALEAQCMQLPTSQDQARALQPSRPPRGGGYSPAPDGQQEGAPQQQQQQQQQRGRYTKPSDRDPFDLMLSEYMDLCMLLANIAKDTGYQPSQGLVDAVFSRQVWRITAPPLDLTTRLLWVASNLSARPSPQWFEYAMNALAFKDRYWEPAELGNVCLYLSRYLQQRATPPLANKLWRFLDTQRYELGPDGVASVLYFLAMSGSRPQERLMDDVLIWLKPTLPNCSLTGLELIYNSLPLLGSGFRLNEVITDAANRYNAAVAAQAAAAEGEPQAMEAQTAAV